MKKLTIVVMLLSAGLLAFNFTDFFTQQLAYPRVKQANASKGDAVAQMFEAKNIPLENFDLFIRAFKEDETVEVWAKGKENTAYQLVKSYPFCASTGKLGPKRRSGDKQIPEGFYTVDKFNPQSMYHLSFRISYPNESDLKFADKLNPGGDIFIHGDCITIGCIPIGNESIEELYLIAAKAKAGNGKMDVHIFPAKMTDARYSQLRKEYNNDKKLIEFWSWLKPGFDAFEKNKIVPEVIISEDGSYKVNS